MLIGLIATLKLVLSAGSAAEPAALVPPTPTSEPIAIWWDAAKLHVGNRAYAWSELGVKPTNGASFKVSLGEIDHAEHFLTGTIDTLAPRYAVTSCGVIGNADVNTTVKVWPKKGGRMSAALNAQGQTPNYFNLLKAFDVKAGVPAEITFKDHGSSSGSVWYHLYDTDGREIFYSGGEYRDPKLIFDYQYIWTKAEEKRMVVVTKNWTKYLTGNYTMRVTARDFDGDRQEKWSKTQPLRKAYGLEEYAFDVADLPEGFYWMHVDYIDANGQTVHSDKGRYYKPGEKAPWDDNKLGAEDTVPPPWTEPTFGEQGLFTCWNREIQFGGKGLITSIKNAGAEMLTEPIAVLLDGKPLTFRVELMQEKTSKATYRLKAKEAEITVLAVCDFDGYVRFHLRYPKGTRNLSWRAGIRRDWVKCFDDGARYDEKDMFTKETCLDRTFDISARRHWWVGGVKGLYCGMTSLRGTHIRDLERSGRVFADVHRFYVEANLVDETYAGKEKRVCGFYIEPSPVKPKDMAFAAVPSNKIVGWTGHLTRFFEFKYPGFEIPELCEPFRKRILAGDRVFLYNSSNGVGVESPMWGWYNQEWTRASDLSYYAHEAPLPLEGKLREMGNWAYGCLNSKSFFDWKIWGVNWALHNLIPEAKDLYFDLANACACGNRHHGCVWKDDFGREMHETTFESVRELHKRIYRLVKAKNKDGLMFGHTTDVRTPGDVFFDFHTMGESLAIKVSKQDSYYEILTPDVMQGLFMPHAVEQSLECPAQFLRWRQCWAPDLYRNYNPYEPKLNHAIRHYCAYMKIHDIKMQYASGYEGRQYRVIEEAVSALHKDRERWAYYTEGEVPVTLSAPGPRQLWAYQKNPNGAVLVVLNDTDEGVIQKVSVKGLSATGKELLTGEAFDFSSGSCALKLPARGALFIRFAAR